MVIGVLALQGDYSLHAKILSNNNVENKLVKNPSDLSLIDGLIIPGGESTVILKLLNKYNFIKSIIKFSTKKNIYGTCAGAIIMSNCTDDKMKTLKCINIKSYRNFWGRQINSFTHNINLKFSKNSYKAHFIRAPKFVCQESSLQILANFKNEAVLIRNDKHLVSSFHPEMTNDFSIHKYFIDMINNEV